MGAPGFWDDQDPRRRRSTAEHAGSAAGSRPSGARVARRTTSRRSRSSPPTIPRSPPSSNERRGRARRTPRRARGGAAVLRPLRRRRRGRGGHAGAGRHGLPGLGRDAAAHGDALGRAARLRGRAEGGERGEEAGIKSATFVARGENAYGLFSAEKGVHRLVRISPFDAAARRHTAFALVEVSPLVEEDVDVEIDDADLQIDTYRASGAGGQHVNKTDSAVRITHRPTRDRRPVPERALAVLEQGDGDGDAALPAARAEEHERREELAREKGEAQDVAWGSQIRSYVLQPYTMVKDHRTSHEMGDASACSTATSTASCAPSCCAGRVGNGRAAASPAPAATPECSSRRPRAGRGPRRRRPDQRGRGRADARARARDRPEGRGGGRRARRRRGGLPRASTPSDRAHATLVEEGGVARRRPGGRARRPGRARSSPASAWRSTSSAGSPAWRRSTARFVGAVEGTRRAHPRHAQDDAGAARAREARRRWPAAGRTTAPVCSTPSWSRRTTPPGRRRGRRARGALAYAAAPRASRSWSSAPRWPRSRGARRRGAARPARQHDAR